MIDLASQRSKDVMLMLSSCIITFGIGFLWGMCAGPSVETDMQIGFGFTAANLVFIALFRWMAWLTD
jgi:hypothetical protein